MNKLGTVVTALLFVFGLGLCRANLNETEAQCIARYGAVTSVKTDLGYKQVGNQADFFTKKTANGSVDIKVVFLNGLSCHETICNSDPSAGLSMDQMKAILDSQGSGMKWEKGRTQYRTFGGDTYGTIEWRRSDGAEAKFWVNGKAGFQTQTGQVSVSTKQYATVQAVYDKENGSN